MTELGHEMGRFEVLRRSRATINLSQEIETFLVATPMGTIAVAAEPPHFLVRGLNLDLRVRQRTLLRPGPD